MSGQTFAGTPARLGATSGGIIQRRRRRPARKSDSKRQQGIVESMRQAR